MSRRFAVIAITLGALGFGVSAGPAFAGQQTPLAAAVEQAQDASHLQFYENLHTRAGDHKAIKVLIDNAYACEQGAETVARVPAIKAQQADKAEWLSGERLQARMDVQMADAVYMVLAGDTTPGYEQLASLGDESNRVDSLTARASNAIGA